MRWQRRPVQGLCCRSQWLRDDGVNSRYQREHHASNRRRSTRQLLKYRGTGHVSDGQGRSAAYGIIIINQIQINKANNRIGEGIFCGYGHCAATSVGLGDRSQHEHVIAAVNARFERLLAEVATRRTAR